MQMRPLNDSFAWLVRLEGFLLSQLVVVTDGEAVPIGAEAVDFGAVDHSDRTMLTVLKPRAPDAQARPFRRIGVTVAKQVTDDAHEATLYAALLSYEDTAVRLYQVRSNGCLDCNSRPLADLTGHVPLD